MNIELKFTDLTLEEVQHIANSVLGVTLIGGTTSLKPSRKRRTKAEMAEAREVDNTGDYAETDAAEQEEGPRSQGEDDPPTPRRRKRGDDENPTDGASTAGGSSRKKTRRPAVAGTAKSPSQDDPSPKRQRRRKKADDDEISDADDDEISDADVAKAASEGAEQHTPKVVTGILEEFGVDNVAELSQEQRREFMTQLDDYVAY